VNAGSYPLSRGDRGDAVASLQSQLAVIGYPTTDESGSFESRTVAAVEAFQRSKGLPITGLVDELTAQRIEEARWRLGQRLLFLARPHLRGDDVAALQTQLAQLGFNPGRVDGIFGVNTEMALRDFQRNCGLEANGTLTRSTWGELQRLRARPGQRPVTEVRETAGFDDSPGPLVITGDPHRGALLADVLEGPVLVHQYYDEPSRVALDANARRARLVVAITVTEGPPAMRLAYWAGFHTHSRTGEFLAGAIATRCASLDNSPLVEVAGMALPLLRETRMPSLHVELTTLSDEEFFVVTDAISVVLRNFMHSGPSLTLQ
jgi:N-acetylmuramoyl-L-alanine amidase